MRRSTWKRHPAMAIRAGGRTTTRKARPQVRSHLGDRADRERCRRSHGSAITRSTTRTAMGATNESRVQPRPSVRPRRANRTCWGRGSRRRGRGAGAAQTSSGLVSGPSCATSHAAVRGPTARLTHAGSMSGGNTTSSRPSEPRPSPTERTGRPSHGAEQDVRWRGEGEPAWSVGIGSRTSLRTPTNRTSSTTRDGVDQRARPRAPGRGADPQRQRVPDHLRPTSADAPGGSMGDLGGR